MNAAALRLAGKTTRIQPRRRNTMKTRLNITLLLSIALVAVSCLPTPTATITPTLATAIKITYPTEGSKVEQIETVKGSSQAIPDGSVIWLVVFVPSVGRYFPQNRFADMLANGTWTSVVYIGQPGESGLKADVVAVLADKDAQAAFDGYLKNAMDKQDYPGLEQLPEGAVQHVRVSVVRR
jgi:hypothetical protein